jgi:hypothetical protein
MAFYAGLIALIALDNKVPTSLQITIVRETNADIDATYEAFLDRTG